MRSKTFFRGFVTSPLFWIGSLLILILFLRRKTSLSQTEISRQIQSQIHNAGYSDNVGNFWAAVSRFETGNFKSNLAVAYNNYFGMKWNGSPSVRFVEIGTNKWANPSSLEDSVSLQIDYMKRKHYATDYKSFYDFVTFMKTVGYFEEPFAQYWEGVKTYIE